MTVCVLGQDMRCDCYTELGCELIQESERGKMIGKGMSWCAKA